ncbi:MAG: hypothetical protein M3O35_06625 [Acidobacteriota bacterium]|nr:hypothetical protein [Acidobacteriota bacterium]
MPRTFLALFIAAGVLASAAIFPSQIGPAQRVSAQPATLDPADRPLWDEFGLLESEQADYGDFTATAWRFRDSTGAFAASEWLRKSQVIAAGNYLLRFEGKPPARQVIDALRFPGQSFAALPVVRGYLPSQGLIPNSERYILGPASLQRFEPALPAQAAAFQFGAEAQTGRYRSKTGDLDLAIFSYPTPGMARQQAAEFQKLPGTVVKRTGPLVAVVTGVQDPSAAQKLLANLQYEANGSWSVPIPLIIRPQTAGQIVMGAITLAGIIIAFCFLSGLVFGVTKLLRHRYGPSDAGGAMILLHLREK